jgi:HD-GYP domain-containing protein (c-di-GMP phosphodiesterase class II)
LVLAETNATQEQHAFGTQCAESGLLAWRYSVDGPILAAPWLPPTVAQWAASPRLAELIGLTFASGGDGDSRDIELYPGCWIAAALDSTDSGPVFWITLALAEAGLGGATFEEICASAGLNPTAAADALGPWVRSNLVQKDQVVATFVRYHQHLATSLRDRDMIGQFTSRLSQAYEELNLFFRLARLLNTSGKPAGTIQAVCQELKDTLPFDWVAASFVIGAGKVPELSGEVVSAGTLPCMPGMLSRAVASACSQTPAMPWVRVHNPPRTALANLAGTQVIAELLSNGQTPIGAFLAGGKNGPDAEVTSEELQLISAAAGLIGIYHENLARFAQQKAQFLATVRSLAASIDAKDRYTRGHSERVSVLGAALARALGMDEETVEQYRVAGLLHDVGKIGTPEAILTKMGRLTEEEFREIMKHPEIGYEILKDIPGISFALPAVLHHHEKFDGTGYPARLAGENIPLIARVLALADTFDAMRSNRSYRSARPHDTVISEIRRCSGTQFDPKLAAIFVELDFSEFERMLGRDSETPLAA